MVKIEQLKDGAKATYTKDYNGEQGSVVLHNLISLRELESMVVTKGTVIYTIDEKTFGEKSAPEAPPAPVVAKPVTKPAAKAVKAAEPTPEEPKAE